MTLDDYKANLHSCSSILTLLEASKDRISDEESDKIAMELAKFMHKISGELCGDPDMSGKNQMAALDERLNKMYRLLSEIRFLNNNSPVVSNEIVEPRIDGLFAEMQTLVSETKDWYTNQRSAQ